MEIGRCPRCSTPYTASELTGFGILRARSARFGGPRMEYTCQACGRLIRLIPHGDGRYAPPGEPPPPAVPPEARRPPWMADGPDEGGPKAPPEPAGVSEPPPVEPPRGRPRPMAEEGAPLDAAEALELLGVTATASRAEIERAFRERSRTCHPDKVAHLDAEFQELAERKFKRLRKACDLLLS